MSFDDTFAAQKLADPDLTEAEFDAALDKSIQKWAEKARQVEIVRAQNLSLRETNNAVEALGRLREIGMEHAERTSREGRGLLSFDEREATKHGVDPGLKFNRIARAVRQIVVLQQELLGNRPVSGVRAVADIQPAAANIPVQPREQAEPDREHSDLPDQERPDRNDLNDLYDYDDRAYGEVVADIRQVLNLSPADDPDFPADVKAPALRVPANTPRKPSHRTHLTASASAVGANLRERGPP